MKIIVTILCVAFFFGLVFVVDYFDNKNILYTPDLTEVTKDPRRTYTPTTSYTKFDSLTKYTECVNKIIESKNYKRDFSECTEFIPSTPKRKYTYNKYKPKGDPQSEFKRGCESNGGDYGTSFSNYSTSHSCTSYSFTPKHQVDKLKEFCRNQANLNDGLDRFAIERSDNNYCSLRVRK